MVIVRDERLLGTGACLRKLISQCKAGMGFIPGMSITVRDICCSCERESWQGVSDQSAGTVWKSFAILGPMRKVLIRPPFSLISGYVSTGVDICLVWLLPEWRS